MKFIVAQYELQGESYGRICTRLVLLLWKYNILKIRRLVYIHRYYTYKGLATRDQNNSDVISNLRYGLYAPSARLLDAQDS